MSAREIAELLLLAGRLVQTEGYDGELSPAPMDGAPLLRSCQFVLPNSVRICGISSDDPWHCITSH